MSFGFANIYQLMRVCVLALSIVILLIPNSAYSVVSCELTTVPAGGMITTRSEFIIVSPPDDAPSLPLQCLDNVSLMVCGLTVSGALRCSGHSLQREQWRSALQTLVTHCPWLAACLQVRQEEVYVSLPRTYERENDTETERESETGTIADFNYDRKGFLQCEMVNFSTSSSSSSTSSTSTLTVSPSCISSDSLEIADFLPMKRIHEKMLRMDLALECPDGLPIAALKITQFADEFVLGYRLNHVFFDQGAVVNMFVFLSDIYRHHGTTNLPVPIFKPRVSMIPDNAKPFSSKNDFLASAPSGYSLHPVNGLHFSPPMKLEIQFDLRNVRNLKVQHPELTTNDLLNAVLIKALSRYRHVVDNQQQVKIYFARNMRNALNLGKETVGDYVRVETLSLPAVDASSKSLVDIALLNRLVLSHKVMLADKYAAECMWFRDFSLFSDDGSRPTIANSSFLVDELAGVVTNWSSFPYEDIKFADNASVTELLIEDAAATCPCGCFVRVCFRIENGERVLVVVINSLHQDFIDAIRNISFESNGLFVCK